jgi:PKD repeat protein
MRKAHWLLTLIVSLLIASCMKKDVAPTLPKAKFSETIINGGFIPTRVDFLNLSENGIRYYWDFGDGDTSAYKNPTHEYTAEGTYDVKLVVFNEQGKDSVIKQIQIVEGPPAAYFSYNIINNGDYPVYVDFTNESSGAVSYRWDFGNGDTSTLQNPRDSFFTPGRFNVKLHVTNSKGTDSIIQTINIVINPPTADFSFTAGNSGVVPSNVQFNNLSTNASTYKWSFSNGLISTAKNPTTGFQIPRGYEVKLVASNPSGSDSITKTVAIYPIMNSVLVYLLTPRDKAFNQAYYNVLKSATLDLQNWYRTKMGNNKTFILNPLVLDTIRGSYDSAWYNSNNGAAISGTDPRFYGYQNTYYDMTRLVPWSTNSFTYFVYVAAPGGGAGTPGFCAMGDQDLKGLLGQNPENLNIGRWIGGGGHELGHAFGLPHPANQNPQAIMWTGYLTYPNCILQQEDKDILNAHRGFQ